MAKKRLNSPWLDNKILGAGKAGNKLGDKIFRTK